MKEQLKTRQQILNEIGELINELNNLPKSAGDVGDSQVLIDILTERFELSSIVFNNISEAMYLMKVEEDTFRMAIVNDAFLQITGFSKENIIGNTPEIFIHEPFREFTLGKYKEAVAINSVQRYENTIDFGNGILVLDVNITPISLQRSNTKYLFGEFRDITQKKAAEKELKLANERLSSLWEISGLENLDDKEIYDRVLNTIVEMTDSPHGFFGMINEDETKMTILSWLGDVMKDCSMVNKPMEYMIEEAGMWGDVLRKRKPIIENNVKSKRFPEGHIELTRLLVCPIYSGKEIVSIAAVANKKSDYSESDLKQVSAYLNGVQLIIDKKKSEIKLKEFSEELMKMNETKEKLMSIISHDLRSPIQGLLGISEALAEEIDILSREEVIEYAKEINIAVKMQYRLLMDLLDWSKIHRTDL